MKNSMGGKSLIIGFIIVAGLFLYIPFSEILNDNGSSGNDDEITEIADANNIDNPVSAVTTNAVEHMEANHSYLNTIDWVIVQPRDLSSAKITTTANSEANQVFFTYRCGDMEEHSSSAPEDGVVENSIEWDCEEVMTTYMKAVGSDTTFASYYTIDMEFINSLGF